MKEEEVSQCQIYLLNERGTDPCLLYENTDKTTVAEM